MRAAADRDAVPALDSIQRAASFLKPSPMSQGNAMRIELACQALRDRKCLELRYDGWSRSVEVHAAGLTKEGNAVMRVWQTQGGSNSGTTGWKLLRLDEVISGHICPENSNAPRIGYKRGDKAMARIVCQL